MQSGYLQKKGGLTWKKRWFTILPGSNVTPPPSSTSAPNSNCNSRASTPNQGVGKGLGGNSNNNANNDNNNQIEIQDLSNIQNMDNNEIIKLIHNLTKNNPNQTQPVQINIINNNSNNTNNTNNTQNNTNNNNTINNTQNNTLNLNNYDNPNCDFLTDEQKNKFLKDRYKGLIDFITYVYFNEAYPENHTILYTNLRSKYGHIYKNNKWFIEEIDMIADKLNDYSFDKLSGHLDEIKADEEKAEIFDKDIQKGERFVEHFTSNDTTKESRSNIKKLIYNNKDLVEKTKEKTIKNKKLD